MFPFLGRVLVNSRSCVAILAAKQLRNSSNATHKILKVLLSYVKGFANSWTSYRMNRRKADFKFAYKFLEDDV